MKKMGVKTKRIKMGTGPTLNILKTTLSRSHWGLFEITFEWPISDFNTQKACFKEKKKEKRKKRYLFGKKIKSDFKSP